MAGWSWRTATAGVGGEAEEEVEGCGLGVGVCGEGYGRLIMRRRQQADEGVVGRVKGLCGEERENVNGGI